jgi:hypothetical protein
MDTIIGSSLRLQVLRSTIDKDMARIYSLYRLGIKHLLRIASYSQSNTRRDKIYLEIGHKE